MEAFQKKMGDVEGKLTGFDEKLSGFNQKLEGVDEVKNQLNLLIGMMSAKKKEVATNDEEMSIYNDDNGKPHNGGNSSKKFISIPINEKLDKDKIGSSKLDDSQGRRKLKETVIDATSKEKLERLDERIRAIEGTESYGPTDASQLCLVPDVIIPHKFKMPEFEKYEGATCPRSHMVMYCNKMANHIRDEKLMIHCFQNSLSGPALRWYMQLERSKVKRWQDLADAFFRHYKHNQDLAPDREDLRNMEKHEKESFREYAHRWRTKAVDVQPPLSEKEMVSIFFDTLKPPYYNNMVGITTTNFIDLLIIGKRIEKGILQGKMEIPEGSARLSQKKRKEEEVYSSHKEAKEKTRKSNFQNNQALPYVATTTPILQPPNFMKSTIQHPTPIPRQGANRDVSITRKAKRVFDPIPVTYTELFPRLLHDHLITPIPGETLQPPFPRWYRFDKHCDYHSGVQGHSVENCNALKIKVQDMVNAGWLKFE
ncbi:unnamed protein product [Linum trigynum]|uniref:Retrotransposon gag domain-containing protein n=1 Tax=Linum trigynum TaxID=586398 RepID=A0AAV2GQI1_9ROSI